MVEWLVLLQAIMCTSISWVIPCFLLSLTLYFLIIMPQKLQQNYYDQLDTLTPGMRVKTQNGSEGIILQVLTSTVIIQRDDGHKLQHLKHAITHIKQ